MGRMNENIPSFVAYKPAFVSRAHFSRQLHQPGDSFAAAAEHRERVGNWPRPGGFVFLLISVGYLLGLLGSAFLASRSTHKTTIVISSSGVGLALLVVCLAENLWLIRFGLLAVGFAAGLYMTCLRRLRRSPR
jgi:MFS family permease